MALAGIIGDLGALERDLSPAEVRVVNAALTARLEAARPLPTKKQLNRLVVDVVRRETGSAATATSRLPVTRHGLAELQRIARARAAADAKRRAERERALLERARREGAAAERRRNEAQDRRDRQRQAQERRREQERERQTRARRLAEARRRRQAEQQRHGRALAERRRRAAAAQARPGAHAPPYAPAPGYPVYRQAPPPRAFPAPSPDDDYVDAEVFDEAPEQDDAGDEVPEQDVDEASEQDDAGDAGDEAPEQDDAGEDVGALEAAAPPRPPARPWYQGTMTQLVTCLAAAFAVGREATR